MAIRSIEILKSWFRKGMYPTESQFADWLDSYRHKSEKVAVTDVDGLADALNTKAEASDVSAAVSAAQEAQMSADEALLEAENANASAQETLEQVETASGMAQEALEALDDKLNSTDVVDNLTTADGGKALSANQGVVLKNLIESSAGGTSSLPVDIKFHQRIYRNLEGDNDLAIDDFTGRAVPLQTPMLLADTGTDDNGQYYVVQNMPYVEDLVKNPTNWGLWSMTVQPQPDSVAVKCTQVAYLGAYSTFSNCCKIHTNGIIASAAVGNYMAIMSWKAYGLEIDTTIHFPRQTGTWNTPFGGCATLFRRSDGVYCAIVHGYEKNKSTQPKIISHLYTAPTIHGAWTDVTGASGGDIFNSAAVAAGYVGVNSTIGCVEVAGRQGMYATACGLTKSDGTMDVGILVFDEYLRDVRAVKVTLDFTPTLALCFYYCIGYYKGQYLLVMHDGTPQTGRRIVFSSPSITGTFKQHSVVYDNDEINPGSLRSYQTANGSLFTLNGHLYYVSSGQSAETLSGTYSNHEAYLYEYLEGAGWALVANPWIIASHSQHLWGADYAWGKDHMGGVNGFLVEGNNMYLLYSACAGTDTYQVTVASIDLTQA